MGDLPARVVVIGAGTMGARIAACLARAGIAVCATARREETLRSAAAVIRAALTGPDSGASPAADRVLLTTDAGAELARADLVIETIAEDLAAKAAVLGHVAARARPDAVITTNTSSLDLAALAAAAGGPERFAGLHWFNPADLIRLVEVVPAPGTSAATVAALHGWMLGLGKAPVVLNRATAGFVANRLQYALIREAYALVAAGVCGWAEADLAVTAGLGPRWAAVGPFQSMDLAGLDVHLAVAEALFPVLATDREPPGLLAGLVAGGHLGAKSGTGLLGDYPPERRQALMALRDRVLRAIAGTVTRKTVTRKEASDGSE